MNWGSAICILWMGMILGLSFIATPAKFLAPAVSLPDLLAIGRATFNVFFWIEGIMAILLLATILLSTRMTIAIALIILLIAVILSMNYLIIQPILDVRVQAIIDGQSISASSLHRLYIAFEALKVIVLGGLGWKLGLP